MAAKMEYTDDDARLVFDLKNSRPVELADLTKSLNSLASQYKRFVSRRDLREESTAKLYVREIRDGSIIAELFSYVSANYDQVPAITKTSQAVIDFGLYLKKTFKELEDGKEPSEDNLTKKDLADLSGILEPATKDPEALFQIHADRGANVTVTVNLNNRDANTIQNQSSKMIETMRETDQRLFYKRAFYWHSASRGKSSRSDKGVIETIEDSPVAVIFEDENIKKIMLAGKNNPFFTAYIVDVELIILKGRTQAYKILALHDVIENDDEEEGEVSN